MKICPKCGHENEDVNFCSSCGNDLRTQSGSEVYCSHCGNLQSNADNVYCSKCGKRLKGRGRSKYLWLSLAVVAVIGLLIGAKMYSSKSDETLKAEQMVEADVQLYNEGDSGNAATVESIPVVFTEKNETEEEQQPEDIPKHPIAVDGGNKHSVILYSDGTVITIGNDTYAQRSTSGWRDIIQISTFSNHTLGLKADGTVVAAGSNYQGQCEVSGWKDIVCVAAGTQHSVGLKRDGTVVAVGVNGSGQCDVSDWTGVKYVAANATSTFALTEGGRILSCGSFQSTTLDSWQDIVSFSVSMNHVVGVHSDGTVSAVGANDRGQRDGLEKKRDLSQVAVGYGFTAGLKTNGNVWVNGCGEHNEHAAMQWKDIVAIGTGKDHILGIKKDGTLVAKGTNDDGQCDVYALNQLMKE